MPVVSHPISGHHCEESDPSLFPHKRYLYTMMRCFFNKPNRPALIFQKKPQFFHVCGPILDSVSPCCLYLWRPRTGCSSPVVSLGREKGSLPSIQLILQAQDSFLPLVHQCLACSWSAWWPPGP